jgi:hypothetical protein
MMKNKAEEKVFDYLVDRLLKECKNSKGYIGVEYDNFNIHEGESLVEILFHKILDEMVSLGGNIDEYVENEYDKECGLEKPFKTEKNAIQHIDRLRKFIKKYASKVLNEEKANSFIEKANKY